MKNWVNLCESSGGAPFSSPRSAEIIIFLKGPEDLDLKSALIFPWKCFMFWLSNFRDVQIKKELIHPSIPILATNTFFPHLPVFLLPVFFFLPSSVINFED